MFYLGIDVGKTNHVASMLADHEQKPLFKGFSFTNTVEGAESLVSMIDRFVHDGDKLSIGIISWKKLHHHHPVHMTHNFVPGKR